MEVFAHIPSDRQCLAFTVKRLGKVEDATVEDYQHRVLNTWARLAGVTVREPYFEKDDVGKLHMHGILDVRRNYYKKKLQVPGYYIYTTDCYDLEHWIEYCTKVGPLDQTAMQLLNLRNAINNHIYML